MTDFEDIGDLYNLNDTNTKLYREHQEWYDKYKAASIGSLLDNMQSIIDRYERAMDNSSSELTASKEEFEASAAYITNLESEVKELKDKVAALETVLEYRKYPEG